MSELTNLTDRIAHLRERKGTSEVLQANRPPSRPSRHPLTKERKFATDTFMLFAYGLVCIALMAQFILIFWLDVI